MPPTNIGFVPRTVGPLRASGLSREQLEGARVQGIYVCLPKPLAGMGTRRQLQGVMAGVRELGQGAPLDIGFIGPAVAGSDPLLLKPLAEIPPAETVADSYRHAVGAFKALFHSLAPKAVDRIAVLCMGYTAYGPESIKRALSAYQDETGRSGPRQIFVFVIDSAYPDTDGRETGLDADGWPMSRFYSPAFESDDRVGIAFLLTSAYPYNFALLNQRAPEGLIGVSVVAPPYAEEYLAELKADGRQGKELGTGELSDRLPGLTTFGKRDLLVPLVSSDVWSEEAVGAWMTADEHRSCTQGTSAIARALVIAARRLGRRIWVPIDVTGAGFLSRCGIDGLAIAGAGAAVSSDAAVVLSPYRGLPQRAHTRLLGAADLAISRTGGQANATCVVGLAKTPNLVLDMPACGYMQSELTSLFMTHRAEISPDGRVSCEPLEDPLGWRGAWHWPPEGLADLLENALADETARRRYTDRAFDAFYELSRSPMGNVFTILSHLTS